MGTGPVDCDNLTLGLQKVLLQVDSVENSRRA